MEDKKIKGSDSPNPVFQKAKERRIWMVYKTENGKTTLWNKVFERRFRMMNRREDRDEDIKASLGKGAEFNGKLVLNGSVRIDGEFRGEALGSGTLIIGEGAYAEADIAVDSIVISGEVRGNLNIKKRTEISPTGRLVGNVKTSLLVVREGAVIDGACQMSDGDTGEDLRDKTAE